MESSSREPRSRAQGSTTYKTVTPPRSTRHRTAVFATRSDSPANGVVHAERELTALSASGLVGARCPAKSVPIAGLRHLGRRATITLHRSPTAGHCASLSTDVPGMLHTVAHLRSPPRKTPGTHGRHGGHGDVPHAAQDPFLYSVRATSTFERSVGAIASQFLAHRRSVFHEYRCLGLWKSLLAT
jgi:hypothetical protein